MHLVQHPNPNAPFRGSLVDENIFAIDVKEWGLENLQSEYRTRHLRKPSMKQAPKLGVVRKSAKAKI